jgi:hypothetical protein
MPNHMELCFRIEANGIARMAQTSRSFSDSAATGYAAVPTPSAICNVNRLQLHESLVSGQHEPPLASTHALDRGAP